MRASYRAAVRERLAKLVAERDVHGRALDRMKPPRDPELRGAEVDLDPHLAVVLGERELEPVGADRRVGQCHPAELRDQLGPEPDLGFDRADQRLRVPELTRR